MNNKTEKNNSKIMYIVYSVLIIIAVIGAIYISKKDIADTVVSQINYIDKPSINYKVYYKDNPFYDEPYLNEGYDYVSQYVDTIDADFDYYFNYSEAVNGTYDYYVKTTLYVYEPGEVSNEYWKKSYKNTDKITNTVNNQTDYHVKNNFKINFNTYVNDYNEYKANTILSTSAKLVVEFIIDNNIDYNGIDELKGTKSLKLEIPISDAHFKISSIAPSGINKTYVKKEINSQERTLKKSIVISLWIFAGVLLLFIILRYVSDLRKSSPYQRKLKKILTTYDNVIVHANKMPFVNELSVVFVTSFEELVDAQAEVRLPINFKENKRKQTATFILVRNNIAWVYQLKGSDKNEE